jgi:hypothetical protein
MKSQLLLVVLTIVNAAMLISQQIHPHPASAQEVVPVIRTRALEIVDDHGHVRASIGVLPPIPGAKVPDGTTGYPETVLLRLITSKGRPNVKIAATEDGSVVSLDGNSDPTDLQILARGTKTSLKLINKDGKQQFVKP